MPSSRSPIEGPTSSAESSDPARQKKVQRTGTGILLLILAVLLQWIPLVEIVGLIVGAIGVVLIILGADAFPQRHARFVWTSVSLYLIGFLAALVLGVGFASTVSSLPANASGSAAASTLLAAFDGLITGALVSLAFLSVSQALIVFDLEGGWGKTLLLSAVVVQMVISVLLFALVLDPLVHAAVSQAFASGTLDLAPIVAADDQIRGMSGYTLLNALPAVLFGVGYSEAYRRLTRGALPQPIAPPQIP